MYVAVNIYAHEEDLDGLAGYLKTLREIGVDAIIAADPAVIATARRETPDLEIHLSTQQSALNWRTVKFWKEQGIPRIVLAREAGLDDIALIKRKVDIEIETFIHGAMCSSYSGRCVLSNHFTDRDSNRGGCSQSCRWSYDLHDSGGAVLARNVPLFGESVHPFTMGSRDLALIGHIPELIEAGIDSFKIEGRMRSIHYVATAVHAYRQAVDAYLNDPDGYETKAEWLEELGKAASRPLGTGFFLGEPGADGLIYGPVEKAAPYEFAGQVLAYDPSVGVAAIRQRSPFKVGQEVEFFGPEGVRFRQVITEMRRENGEPADAARHPLETVYVKVNGPVRPMDMMRKKTGTGGNVKDFQKT